MKESENTLIFFEIFLNSTNFADYIVSKPPASVINCIADGLTIIDKVFKKGNGNKEDSCC